MGIRMIIILGIVILGLAAACTGEEDEEAGPPLSESLPQPVVTPTPDPMIIVRLAIEDWTRFGSVDFSEDVADDMTGALPVADSVVAQAIRSTSSGQLQWEVDSVRQAARGRLEAEVNFTSPLQLKLLGFERSFVLRFSYSALVENEEIVEANLKPGSASVTEGTVSAQSPAPTAEPAPTAQPVHTTEPAPTAKPVPTAEPVLVAAPAPTAPPVSKTPTIVQYCQSDDEGFAADISNARNWPLIQSCSRSALEEYDRWILVGGQYANDIYKQVFGDAITEADQGFTVIRRANSYSYGGKSRIVWGVAGWTSSDTLSAASYVIDNGLPNRNVKERY